MVNMKKWEPDGAIDRREHSSVLPDSSPVKLQLLYNIVQRVRLVIPM